MPLLPLHLISLVHQNWLHEPLHSRFPGFWTHSQQPHCTPTNAAMCPVHIETDSYAHHFHDHSTMIFRWLWKVSIVSSRTSAECNKAQVSIQSRSPFCTKETTRSFAVTLFFFGAIRVHCCVLHQLTRQPSVPREVLCVLIVVDFTSCVHTVVNLIKRST